MSKIKKAITTKDFLIYMGDLCTTCFGPKGISSGNDRLGPNHVVNRSPIYVTKAL